MALPTITLTGNLTADPDLRFTTGGKPVTNFRVACTHRIKNDQGMWQDHDTCFIDVISWRNAEQVADDLKKGSAVVVTGVLKQRKFQAKDGTERTVYEVHADDVALVIKSASSGYSAPAPAATDAWAGSSWGSPASDSAPF